MLVKRHKTLQRDHIRIPHHQGLGNVRLTPEAVVYFLFISLTLYRKDK